MVRAHGCRKFHCFECGNALYEKQSAVTVRFLVRVRGWGCLLFWGFIVERYNKYSRGQLKEIYAELARTPLHVWDNSIFDISRLLSHSLNTEDMWIHKATHFSFEEILQCKDKSILELLDDETLPKRQVHAVKTYGSMLSGDTVSLISTYGHFIYLCFSAVGINRFSDSLSGFTAYELIPQYARMTEDDVAPDRFLIEIQKTLAAYQDGKLVEKFRHIIFN